MRYSDELEWAKWLIEEIASGRITPDKNEEYFLEDSVHLSVWTVEENDPDWILSIVVDRLKPFSGRFMIVHNMIKLKKRALDLLYLEDPNFKT